MFEERSLSSLIQERIHFRAISTGWLVGKCALCNDYKERAGFLFEPNAVVYNCWNCSAACVYEEHTGKISSKFRKILNALSIDDSDISSVVNSGFFNKKEESSKISLASITKVNTTTATIKLPPKSMQLGVSDEFTEYQEKLIDYLLKRSVNPLKDSFFFSLEERFRDRIIIPFYRNGNLIYWQARSIRANEKKRYDNAPVSREAIMYNFDALSRYSSLPLLVSEGVFDAKMFDGLALIGSKLNDAKAELLSKSPRRLIFIIDKDTTGRHLAEDVLSRGWEIAFVPDGAKDLNDSVCRFGRAWTARELMKSIPKDGDAARLSINLNCK